MWPHELGRVVEHLAVVIGAVTPAERNRLIADAHLLGLDHDRARRMVDELIDEVGLSCDGSPEPLHDPTATVVVSADRIELIAVPTALDHDQAAMRVVLLDSVTRRVAGHRVPQATVECCSRRRIELASTGAAGEIGTTSAWGCRLRSCPTMRPSRCSPVSIMISRSPITVQLST